MRDVGKRQTKIHFSPLALFVCLGFDGTDVTTTNGVKEKSMNKDGSFVSFRKHRQKKAERMEMPRNREEKRKN